MAGVREVLHAPAGSIGTQLAEVKRVTDQLGKLFFDLGVLKNRDLFDALWPHVWRLKDELGLVVIIGEQRLKGTPPTYPAPDYPGGVFRGGMLGELRELIQPVNGGYRAKG